MRWTVTIVNEKTCTPSTVNRLHHLLQYGRQLSDNEVTWETLVSLPCTYLLFDQRAFFKLSVLFIQVSNEATYQEVVRATCGKVTGVVCEVAIAIYTFGTCIAFFIVIGDQLDRCKCILSDWLAFFFFFSVSRKPKPLKLECKRQKMHLN